MTTFLPCAEDMQRVAEVRAREVERQQLKWIAVFALVIVVAAVVIRLVAMKEIGL